MTITWNNTLATGSRQIDLQHLELVDLLNELAAAHRTGRDEEALGELLPQLSSYVLFHFGTEEMLMLGLPADHAHVVAHRQAHRAFSTRIEALRARAAAGDQPPLGPLLDYLTTWLLEHIMHTDRELVALIGTLPSGHRPM